MLAAPRSFPSRFAALSLRGWLAAAGLAALTAAASASGCAPEGAAGPDLACPKGLQAVWVDAAQTTAECQVPLPMADSRNGLLADFPAMVRPPGSLNTPDRIELGRLLFFDPVLSGDNTISCAHCHHPDKGYADGRAFAIGTGGNRTGRSAPTIWNAAFSAEQFWDGRATTLEDQAKGPIQNPGEMNETADHVVSELKAIGEYAQRFDKAFGGSGGSGVTFDNLAAAIATYERSVISVGSAYDRFAAGDTTALSASARHGLTLFRSVSTRCFECHRLPTFASSDYKVIGVPDAMDPTKVDADIGRAKIVPGAANEKAFKVPTLRNIAQTGPYMHNGVFKTLEEVLDFYSKGGGMGLQTPYSAVDDKIGKFDLADDEKADLVEFMKSLTDESLSPPIPAQVPSGLPVLTKFPS